MSKKDFSVALKYVEARPRSQRRRGAEARVSGISVGGSGVSATDLSLLNTNLISVTNNFTALKDLFDSMFEKDSEGNIHAKLSLWSSGGITAGGVGSGGSGGGGGISYSRLDSWADYSADKSGWVLSALLGKDLDDRVSALANAGYITQSALAPYALRSEIPSLVGYATESFVTSQGYITQSTLGGYATQSWVGDNFLSKSGGQIYGELAIKDGATYSAVIRFRPDAGAIDHWLGVNRIGELWFSNNGWSKQWNILHTGNYSDYALPKTGGTLTGTTSIPLYIKSSHATEAAVGFGANNAKGYGYIVYKGGDSWAVTKEQWGAEYSILHTGNYTDYALSVNGGTVNGSVYMNGWFLLGNSQPIAVADTDGVYQAALYLSGGNNFSIGYGTSVVGKRRTLLFGNIIEFKSNGGEDNTLVLNADRTATFSSTVSAPSFIGNLVGTADNSKGFGGYTWEIKQNSIDTWVPVFTFNKIQYREIPADYNNAPSTLTVKHAGTADSTTKLATPRTIWGQSFDGTQDITGALTAPSITANSLTIGGATITYDSANEALCINGNMYALGGITAGGAGISAYTSLEARVARLEQQLNIS